MSASSLVTLNEHDILGLLAEESESKDHRYTNDSGRSVHIVSDDSGIRNEVVDALLDSSLPLYAKTVLKLKVARHHLEWAQLIDDALEDARDTQHKNRGVATCLAPRDHGKSVLFGYGAPIWFADRVFPAEGGAIACEGDLAQEKLKHIKFGNENGSLLGISNTPGLEHLVPRSRSHWKDEYVQLTNGSSIRAKGAKSAWRGKHPRWLVIDDLLSQECAFSELERRRTLANLREVLIPMVKNGVVLIVGCVTPNTWVSTAEGMRTIGELCPGEMSEQTLHPYSGPDVLGKDGVRPPSHYWVNGTCPTKRVRLANGLELEGSHRHPLWVMGADGVPTWRRMDEIAEGALVAVSVGANLWGKRPDLSDEESQRLGFSAAGSGTGIPSHIMGADESTIEQFLIGAARNPLFKTNRKLHQDAQIVRLNQGVVTSIVDDEGDLWLRHERMVPGDDGFVWIPVQTVVDSEAFTVDFVIPDGASFVSNGIVSHNTPLAQDDVYGAYLAKNSAYRFKKFPALRPKVDEHGNQVLDKSGAPLEEALWPGRYSVAHLHKMRDEEFGQLVFAREYMCEPITNLSSLFPDELFTRPTLDSTFRLGTDIERVMDMDWIRQACPNGRFISMDIGISANLKADYTVIWVQGIDETGVRRVLHVYRRRGLGFHTMIQNFNDLGVLYDVDLGVIESNQAQAFVSTDARMECPFPILEYQTGAEKHFLDQGIPSLRLLYEQRKMRLPRGDQESIRTTQIVISELQAMTFEGGKVVSTGPHKDTVLAWWLCEQGIRRMGYGRDVAHFDASQKDEMALLEYWKDDEDNLDRPELVEIREGFGHDSLRTAVDQGIGIPSGTMVLGGFRGF